jgi:hypothetical protein
MQTTQLDHELWDAVTEALALAGRQTASGVHVAGGRTEPPATQRKLREPSVSAVAPAR